MFISDPDVTVVQVRIPTDSALRDLMTEASEMKERFPRSTAVIEHLLVMHLERHVDALVLSSLKEEKPE